VRFVLAKLMSTLVAYVSMMLPISKLRHRGTLAAAALSVLLVSSLDAEINVTFAGGTNPDDPLILTVVDSVTYVVTTAT
jgi:hypothetical protein